MKSISISPARRLWPPSIGNNRSNYHATTNHHNSGSNSSVIHLRWLHSAYWYLVVPCFCIVGLVSLRELHHSLSLERVAYRHYPGEEAHRPQQHHNHPNHYAQEDRFASSHYHRQQHDVYRYQQLQQENAEDDQDQDQDHPVDPNDPSISRSTHTVPDNANSWWQSLQQFQTKKGEKDISLKVVFHPEFRDRLQVAKRELLEGSNRLSSSINKTESFHQWKPASTYPHQTIAFSNPLLPSPHIPNVSHGKDKDNDNQSSSSPTVVILVLSAQQNFERRQAIRETWASSSTTANSCCQVYFVIGHSNCNATKSLAKEEDEANRPLSYTDPGQDGSQKLRRRRLEAAPNTPTRTSPPPKKSIRTDEGKKEDNCVQRDHDILWQEQLKYRDLMEIPMVESYQQLPEKVVQAYQWILQELPPSVKWLVKADDDTYVRTHKLARYLHKYNAQIPMWIGKFIPHSPVAREGKWAESGELYPHAYYPYWAQGSAGHIVSRTAAQYVVEHSAHLHRYQGEDVSLGIWFDQAKDMNTRDGSGMRLTYIQAKSMITNDGIGQCGSDRVLMVGHDLTVEEMYECYLRFHSSSGNSSLVEEEENTWIDEPAEFAALAKAEEGEEDGEGEDYSSTWGSDNGSNAPPSTTAHSSYYGASSRSDTGTRQVDNAAIVGGESFSSLYNSGGGTSAYSDGTSPLIRKTIPKGRTIGYQHPPFLREHLRQDAK